MKDYEEDLRPGIIFLFWIPLALTWIMMALEGPIVASVIARLEEAKLNLAAYGVALSVAFISEGPIIMLVSTATALVRDYPSYRKLLRFALLLNGLITLLLAIVIIPQVFSFLANKVVGLPEEVGRLAYESTVFFLPWPAAIGMRRFYQGILIRHDRTRYVTYGTIIRLASMTAAMMTEGAGTRDALQLADAIGFLGAGINVSAGAHTMEVSLFTPLSKLDSALVLMADVALRPTFPDAELERQRKERLTTLLQWRDEPNALASLTFSRTLYGDHPYGVPSIGSEASIRAVTLEDLRGFHRDHFVSGSATLVVVGDMTRKKQHFLKRISKRNYWVESEWNGCKDATYGRFVDHAICIGIIQG